MPENSEGKDIGKAAKELELQGEVAHKKYRNLKAEGGFGIILLKQKQNRPFLTQEDLLEIINNRELYSETRHDARTYLDQLKIYKEDSLIHLCLSPRLFNLLKRKGWNTIPETERALEAGELQKVGGFGALLKAGLTERLVIFNDTLRVYERVHGPTKYTLKHSRQGLNPTYHQPHASDIISY